VLSHFEVFGDLYCGMLKEYPGDSICIFISDPWTMVDMFYNILVLLMVCYVQFCELDYVRVSSQESAVFEDVSP
jgi:hypothetical protein